MERTTALAALALCALLSTGCATVVRGGSEPITIQTNPSGAEVTLSNGQSCVTPCELEVKRKGDILATIKKPGYKDLNTALVSSIDGASVGIGTAANFLFFPIINDVVDYNTGANYSHKPNPLIVTLIEDGSKERYVQVDPAAKVTPANTSNESGTSTGLPSRFGENQYYALKVAQQQNCPELAMISDSAGVETYSAKCPDGSVIVLQCSNAACRLLE